MQKTKPHKLTLLFIGALAGILCGLLGVGGGVIIVLYLSTILKLDQHTAQSTAISVIIISALVSSFVYYYHGALDWQLIALTASGSIVGGYLGARLMPHLSAQFLKYIFSFFMLLAGLRMLF